MAKQTQEARLAELLAKGSLTEEEIHEIAGMRAAATLQFPPGTVLPPAAFAVPGRWVQALTIENSDVSAGHLADLAKWPVLFALTLKNCRVDASGLPALAAAPKFKGLGLEGPTVTDADLAHVASLTTLEHLYLPDTGVTDAGTSHLAPLTNVAELYIHQTKVGDAGLAALAGMQKLRLLWAHETLITDAGLLTLAVLPRLEVVRIDKTAATDAGKDALFAAQQALKRKAKAGDKPAVQQDPQELERVRATLMDFAEAMHQWEKTFWATQALMRIATGSEAGELSRELTDGCRTVFARYCTDKPLPGFRPDALSCRDPSYYEPKYRHIEEAELDSVRRAFVYARGIYGRLRYTLLKESDRWLVDACHRLSRGRWTTEGL